MPISFVQAVLPGHGGLQTEHPLRDEPTYDDLDDLIGTWKTDEKFDRALAEQHKVDELLRLKAIT